MIVSSPLTSFNRLAAFSLSEIVEGKAISPFGEIYRSGGRRLSPTMSCQTLGQSLESVVERDSFPEVLNVLKFLQIDVNRIVHLILRRDGSALKTDTLVSSLIEVHGEFCEFSGRAPQDLEFARFGPA